MFNAGAGVMFNAGAGLMFNAGLLQKNNWLNNFVVLPK